MSKEFEETKNKFEQIQGELEVRAINDQKAKEDEIARKQEEARQAQVESDQKSIENKKTLERAGVIDLFEEIRNSGLVKMSPNPVYRYETKSIPIYKKGHFGSKKLSHYEREEQKTKIADYESAHISWGKENRFIELRFRHIGDTSPTPYYSFCRIYALDDGRIGVLDFDISEDKKIIYINENNERIDVSRKKDGSLYFFRGWNQPLATDMVHPSQNKFKEIENLSDFVATKLSTPDHFGFYMSSPDPNP